jgi:monoamine oxidase
MPTPTPIDTGRDPVVVIGGGLAGLYAAWRLTQLGAKVVLLEAQQRLGGRILSEPLPGLADPAGSAYDLGPTWYWPALQTRLPRLIRQLGLHAFEQPADGAALFEPWPGQASVWPIAPRWPVRCACTAAWRASSPRSPRDIDPGRVRLGHRVVGLHRVDDALELDVAVGDVGPWAQACDCVRRWSSARCRHVCWRGRCAFDPPLPDTLIDDWLAVPTWMAAQAKFVAVFERAFWRDAGLSGQAQSRVGPLVEIHDATQPGGQPALFGFVGVPAEVRRKAGTQLQRGRARATATPVRARRGGAAAHLLQGLGGRPVHRHDRRRDSAAVPSPLRRHAALPGRWEGRLWLAGTESAREHGGYLEGALEAAELAVQALLAQLPTTG